MSTAASASPALNRSHSSATRNPPSAYAHTPPQQPSRTQSTRHRPTGSTHNRSSSRSHEQDAASVQSGQSNLNNVARQDYERVNLARSSSQRRSSRDGRSAYEEETSRHTRTSSRPNSRRNSQDFTVAPRSATNGASAPPQPPAAPVPAPMAHPNYAQMGRRRTSITTQTGTWQLGKTIGQGSMGKVKVARNAETGETVAIKIIPRQSTDENGNPKDERSDRSKEIRTAREAAMATLLDHPYICGMRDVQRTNYHWYMLFEYVDGGQMLDYIIAHGRLKEKQARKFGRQIASALDYCHRNSIVHRDLKIENILISKSGDIKIIDFGLSNLYSPRSLLKTFCGSLYFAAPELLNARQYTGPEVDVWSFGIVLYVLVCGKVPFDDQSMPQLHAKIKRGHVDYPQWLSAECRSIISRMLVVDVKERATLQEIMCHPWMTKGFNGPPENFVHHREPLQLPLDPAVINKMQGFDFGPANYIEEQITRIVESEDYQSAARRSVRDDSRYGGDGGDRKRGMFEFYKRRNSTSREGLTAPSTEAIRGYDPLNAYSPLISVYLLAKEKIERERVEANPGALSLGTPSDAPALKAPGLPSPEAAHTNTFSPELPGESATGGRARARSRTQGEDDVTTGMKHVTINEKPVQPQPVASPRLEPPPSEGQPRKEGTAMGLLRRFSTRRTKDRDADRPPPPSFNIQPPQESATTTPRKSFSVRRSRRREQSPPTIHTGGSQGQHEGLLGTGASKGRSLLSRSTSVNSGDYRPRKFMSRGTSDAAASPRLAPEPPATSGSEHSSINAQKANTVEVGEKPITGAPPAMPRTPTASRAKSLGHARHESVQARRQRREEARSYRHDNVPEETDAELQEDATEANAVPDTPSADISKPAGLKGLFSSSTTSSKPAQFIRHDLIRVLKQLGVEYTEVRGGFSCRHAPSINLDDVREGAMMEDEKSGKISSGHQRRISFGAFRRGDRDDIREEKMHRQRSQRRQPDQSFITNSEGSDEYVHNSTRGENARDMAATTTRVQEDTGERLVLRFEIAIVKIPLFNLHGIQFKKVQGGMNQYRSMTSTILNSLRL
ncbi:Serine/threonine-protein kinase [Knufia obscura]|uniref:non-specific serine/threonine protein kinase n=1 Tax=Knufia obscura TaxID=1635080 RepID=A0ABR0RBK3_9EURO|nr:Serine/threonine-protein kinase [Knufia obscura]